MCEFCKNADFGSFRTTIERIGQNTCANIVFSGGSNRFAKEEQFNFCPVCGENLRRLRKDA